jgi:glycosyltransferase involved in cell wall biosynthesis
MPELATQAPLNFQFVGFLDPEQLTRLYIDARIIVISTLCFEGFPMTVVEAMLHGKPVVCSRIGGLPEIVEDGITGLLFEAGNAEELSQKIRFLWERPELCARMGKAGREKALKEYSLEKYYERLMLCYDKAMGQQST